MRGFQLLYAPIRHLEDIVEFSDRNSITGIVFASTINNGILEYARQHEIPSVLNEDESTYFPVVIPDSEQGFYLGASFVIEAGHRRIAFIGGTQDYSTTRYRYKGFQRACAEAGIKIDPSLVIAGDWSFDSGYRGMSDIIDANSNLPTAVCACNDMMAIGAIEAIKNAGCGVPDDISVIGYDDIEQGRHMRPRLTTIHSDRSLQAKMICEVLLWSIESREIHNIRITTPSKLVVRDSVAGIRK